MADAIAAGLRGDWETVVATVNAVFGGSRFILLAEKGDATKKPQFEPAVALTADTRLPRGRAFDDEKEVRWRETTKDRFIMTYLSERVRPPADLGFSVSAEEWETNGASQKLCGKRSDKTGDWVEVSTPGVSETYEALVGPERWHSLKVATVDYVRDGIALMTRYRTIQEYEE
jgi:hypothetical protein